jgi:hypothetical protein
MLSATLLRYFYLVQDGADNLFGGDVGGFGFVAESQAVTEHVVGYGAYVLGDYVSAALYEGVGA